MKRWMGCVGLASVASAASGAQPFRVSEHRAWRDDANRTIVFELIYNRVPDFYTITPSGFQADAFQFFIDSQPGNNGWGGTSPLPWESIVRGGEIHVKGDVRIRDHVLGPSTKPISGGWGPIAGSVPYTLVETTQQFTVPFELLRTETGEFTYQLELYVNGSWTGVNYSGSSMPIPGPSGVLIAAGAVVIAARRRR